MTGTGASVTRRGAAGRVPARSARAQWPSRRPGLAVVALLLPAIGCGGSAPEPASTPTTTTATTVSPTTAPRGEEDVAACRLPEEAWVGVGVGFPRRPERLASTGTVRVAVLFADFPDAAAGRSPEEAYSLLDGATALLSSVSYGRLDVVLVPHLEWLRMANPVAHYADAIDTSEGHREWIEEAVEQADAAVDFADADAVVVVANPDAGAIARGPTWVGGNDDTDVITADGAVITNGITSGADLPSWGHRWLVHELGHSLSFVDLYSFSGVPDGYTRPFSLMDDIASVAPEHLAWERWHAGWLDDDQIVCAGSETTVELSPIEEEGGTKAVVVPVARTRAVVVESRRAIGYDSELPREGAVVYVVDTSIESGSGPIEVVNDRQALGEGESVAVEGVTVTVTASTAAGDTVVVVPA